MTVDSIDGHSVTKGMYSIRTPSATWDEYHQTASFEMSLFPECSVVSNGGIALDIENTLGSTEGTGPSKDTNRVEIILPSSEFPL